MDLADIRDSGDRSRGLADQLDHLLHTSRNLLLAAAVASGRHSQFRVLATQVTGPGQPGARHVSLTKLDPEESWQSHFRGALLDATLQNWFSWPGMWWDKSSPARGVARCRWVPVASAAQTLPPPAAELIQHATTGTARAIIGHQPLDTVARLRVAR